jgi:two-component system CheB/CheR fusion protein
LQRDTFIAYVIDPDEAIADGMATLLSTLGIEVQGFPDAESFIASTSTKTFTNGCLLIEADLPGLSGPDLIRGLRGHLADWPVLLLVSTLTPDLVEFVRRRRRIAVLEKPLTNSTLVNAVNGLRKAA